MTDRRFIYLCDPANGGCGAWKGGEDGFGSWGMAVRHFDGCTHEAERVEIQEVAPNLTRARDRAEPHPHAPIPRPMEDRN